MSLTANGRPRQVLRLSQILLKMGKLPQYYGRFSRQFWTILLSINILSVPFLPAPLVAEDANLLVDRNSDGQVQVLAFGDSITYGVGDGTAPGEQVSEIPFTNGTLGYPARLESLLRVNVMNQGVPGELLYAEGISRFPTALGSSNSDIVLLMEGANDAREPTSLAAYSGSLQRIINVSRVTGRQLALLTIVPPCAEHAFLRPAVLRYNSEVRTSALINDLPLADIELAFRTTCADFERCELFNLPEGLHPNSMGYEVIAQTVAARLFGIDIFSDSGAEELAAALGISVEAVVVKPRQGDS